MSTEPRQPTPRRDANPPDLRATEVIKGTDPPPDGNAAPSGSKGRLALSALALAALAVAGVKLGGALSGSEREATALSSASAKHAQPPPPMPIASATPPSLAAAPVTSVTPIATGTAGPASTVSAIPKPKRGRTTPPATDLSNEFGGRR